MRVDCRALLNGQRKDGGCYRFENVIDTAVPSLMYRAVEMWDKANNDSKLMVAWNSLG